MTGEPPAICKVLLAGLAGVALAGFTGTAEAGPLRDGLFRKPSHEGRPASAPPVARYVSEDGHVFVLDRTQGRPLLKFENNPEVWALKPQPAPRGDVIYKNDMGEPVLRATRLGGVTLFTAHRPGGEAVSLAGVGPPLKLAPIGPQHLLERLAQASFRASRAARRTILFEAEATPATSALIADAAVVASVAIVRLSQDKGGRKRLARINRVTLTEGRKATAAISGDVLRITVTPGQGLAGRPSSERILTAARQGRPSP